MLGILIAGAALFALFQVFKKKLFAMITCIVAIVGTILCIIFGGCTICIVFTIINLLAFLGGLAYTLTQQKTIKEDILEENSLELNERGENIQKFNDIICEKIDNEREFTGIKVKIDKSLDELKSKDLKYSYIKYI